MCLSSCIHSHSSTINIVDLENYMVVGYVTLYAMKTSTTRIAAETHTADPTRVSMAWPVWKTVVELTADTLTREAEA